MTHDIPALQEKLRKLRRGIDRLAAAAHAERLSPIFRTPTCIDAAEAIYVHGMMDHLQVQVDDLAHAYETFAAAARALQSPRPSNENGQPAAPKWPRHRTRARPAQAGTGALRFIV